MHFVGSLSFSNPDTHHVSLYSLLCLYYTVHVHVWGKIKFYWGLHHDIVLACYQNFLLFSILKQCVVYSFCWFSHKGTHYGWLFITAFGHNFEFPKKSGQFVNFVNIFLQHGGDMERAAQCMDEARSLDTADRYVNCKCAKYQLRANQVQKAEETCGLFTRVSFN